MDEETEKPPQKSELMKADPMLFNNFWLNEIKSLDDTSGILLSVTILILSAYFTIIGANFEKIKVFFGCKRFVRIFALILLLLPPIFCWYSGIIRLWRTHIGPPLDAEPLLDKYLAKEYMVKIYKYKQVCVDHAFSLLTFPFLYFLGMVILVMISPIKFEKLYLIFLPILTLVILVISDETAFHRSDGFLNKYYPFSEPELIIKADEAGAYYEYKTKKKGWWQFWRGEAGMGSHVAQLTQQLAEEHGKIR